MSFDLANGSGPTSPLLQARDGRLYGVTLSGGANGAGALFQFEPIRGTVKVLHSFVQDGADGYAPAGGLVEDALGNIYGTTTFGGTYFSGTIFRYSPYAELFHREYQVIHSFQGGSLDGNQPASALVNGPNGTLMGTTTFGGANNLGVVFRVTHGGHMTILHAFSGADGQLPQFGLVKASDGDYYGTTSAGGDASSGTSYKIAADGAFTLLHSFSPGIEGGAPSALIQAKDGLFYGTTALGGPGTGGTAYSMAADGTVTVLHAFAPNTPEGDSPNGLTEASDGNLYGANANFGSDQLGSVYRLSRSGTVTVIHRFNPGSMLHPNDGQQPLAPPIQAGNGVFYGTTSLGGISGLPGYGTIYRFGLMP